MKKVLFYIFFFYFPTRNHVLHAFTCYSATSSIRCPHIELTTVMYILYYDKFIERFTRQNKHERRNAEHGCKVCAHGMFQVFTYRGVNQGYASITGCIVMCATSSLI